MGIQMESQLGRYQARRGGDGGAAETYSNGETGVLKKIVDVVTELIDNNKKQS